MGSLTACRSCGSTDLRGFLNLGDTPLADAFPRSGDKRDRRYPLGLTVCNGCWLVQNTETVPDELLWTADYGFYTGASPSSIAYFADYAQWVKDRYGELTRGLVVEIASNDGTLLRHFDDRLGVEPSANVAQAAIDAGVPTIIAPFGRAVAAGIAEKASLIIANNVVAHVADLDDFLGGVASLLHKRGLAIFEFQYVGDLIAGNQFDHVYHEHRSFFGLRSFAAALHSRGLSIQSYIHTPAQGGSLRVVVQHGPSRDRSWFKGEDWLARLFTYQSFGGRVTYIRERLLDLIDGEIASGRTVAGYAASAKSTTLLNYCGIGPDRLKSVVDLTPHKIGRLTPGTRIPIVAEDDVDTYLLLAWNYLPGILRRERAFIDRGGKFIVPIPTPMIL